jgi:hypothetical protein
MADTNNISTGAADPLDRRDLDLTAEELEIIGYFTQGQKHSIVSENLKLEYTETSIRISDSSCKLLGISKQVNQWQRKVLISNKSVYKPSIARMLVASGFITRQKSSHPEFTEYHHYIVPDGYKLNYTEVIQLWKIWWNNKRYQLNAPTAPIDVLIFSKGNWQMVRDLQPKQGNFILLTARGEIKIEPEEYVVWIDLIEPKSGSLSRSSPLEQQQNPATNPSVPLNSNLRSEGNISTEVFSSPVQPMPQLELPIDRYTIEQRDYLQLSAPEEDIDLESYLSTFNTEDAEDVDRIEGIYNIGELLSGSNMMMDDVSPPPPPPRRMNLPTQVPVALDPTQRGSLPVETPASSPELSVSTPNPTQPIRSIVQRQESLKLQALKVLATYLQEGDSIVHTEILKNAQGQEINRKVTKIQRGCPSWAIEQVKQLTSVEG